MNLFSTLISVIWWSIKTRETTFNRKKNWFWIHKLILRQMSKPKRQNLYIAKLVSYDSDATSRNNTNYLEETNRPSIVKSWNVTMMQRHLTTQINISEAWRVRDHLRTTKYWCPEILEFPRSSPVAEATNLFMSTQCVFSMEMTSIVTEGDCKTLVQCSNGRTIFLV